MEYYRLDACSLAEVTSRMSAQVTRGHLAYDQAVIGMTVSVIQSAPCWGALTSMAVGDYVTQPMTRRTVSP